MPKFHSRCESLLKLCSDWPQHAGMSGRKCIPGSSFAPVQGNVIWQHAGSANQICAHTMFWFFLSVWTWLNTAIVLTCWCFLTTEVSSCSWGGLVLTLSAGQLWPLTVKHRWITTGRCICETIELMRCVLMCADVLSCGKTCEAESDHQWLGVSLSRQPGDNGGHILVTHSIFRQPIDEANDVKDFSVWKRFLI